MNFKYVYMQADMYESVCICIYMYDYMHLYV